MSEDHLFLWTGEDLLHQKKIPAYVVKNIHPAIPVLK
jgi:hypothetical protein